MSTLYTNERAFCFLSDEEKAELEAALKDNRVVFLSYSGRWHTRANVSFKPIEICRITKPSIDWKDSLVMRPGVGK